MALLCTQLCGLPVQAVYAAAPPAQDPPSSAKLQATPAALSVGPDVMRAQDLYDNLQFDAAEAAITAALLRPGRARAELAALYRLRGLLNAARDDNGRAQQDFTRWLLLAPDGRLPDGAAPKIVAPFQAAQRDLQRAPALGLRPMLVTDPVPLLRVEVVGDRARLGQAVVVSYAVAQVAGSLRRDVSERTPLLSFPLLGLPPGKLVYTVELLGEGGGRLAQAGSLAAPLVAYPFGPEPLYRKWWLWTAAAGLGVLALGLGVGLGRR